MIASAAAEVAERLGQEREGHSGGDGDDAAHQGDVNRLGQDAQAERRGVEGNCREVRLGQRQRVAELADHVG